MSPRQTSHRGSALLSAAAGQPRSAGQPTGMTVDQCHNLPCISARSQSSGAIRKYASGSAEIFTQRDIPLPSGVLITKPHDSAGAHRRACARIADSVCVINRDLLRKFINGKETAKIADIPAQFTPAHALAASVLRISVVGLSNSSATAGPLYPHSSPR